jgi:hypothetical protein
MTPATGKISEGQIDLDEDECPPAISIAGTDEDIMQVKNPFCAIIMHEHLFMEKKGKLKLTFRFSNSD